MAGSVLVRTGGSEPSRRGFDSYRRNLVEVTRLDEGPVLKTGAVKTVVGSSPTAPLYMKGSWSNRKMLASHASPFSIWTGRVRVPVSPLSI